MEKNAQGSDLQRIQLTGERAVLYEQLTRWSIVACIAIFIALFIIYDEGNTSSERLLGFLTIVSMFVGLGFFLSFRSNLRRTAVLVFEHMRRFHRDRLKQLILDRFQTQPMGGLLEQLDRVERGVSEEKEPVVKTPSAGDLDNALSDQTLTIDPATGLFFARTLLRQAETGSANQALDIDVVRTFYGQLLRLKISVLSRWSGARKKLLAEHLANPAYRAEISSARHIAVRSFALKAVALVLIAGTLVPVLKLDRMLPAREKMALYQLERRLGFPKHAVRWLQLAALDEDSGYRYLLGQSYLTGQDVEKDPYEAAYWFWRSMNKEARLALAEMHRKGSGVHQDEAVAAFWEHQASRLEKKDWLTSPRTDQLKPGLSESDRKLAKRLIKMFEKNDPEFKRRQEFNASEEKFAVWERFATAPCSVEPKFQEVQPYLAMGVDINAIDKNGNTALINAVMCERTETAHFLIQKGIDKEIVNYEGLSALSLAAKLSRQAFLKQLIDSGADVNRPGRQGITPLHWSVVMGHAEAARYLIAHGADLNAKTKSGLTVLQVAGKVGRRDIEVMLREAGAKE